MGKLEFEMAAIKVWCSMHNWILINQSELQLIGGQMKEYPIKTMFIFKKKT